MIANIYQEFYKLAHKKIAWVSPLILLALMVMTGYTIGFNESKLLTMTSYNAPDWIMVILVIVGATTFSMEFQNNAILTLLYKAPNKIEVYLSKYFTIFCYDVFLHALALIFTVGLRYALLNATVPWSTIYQYQQPLWENMLKTSAIDLLTTMLIISLVFLLSCLINSNAVVISTSFLVVFMGQFISGDLLNSEQFVHLLKWNPLNMINLTRQYYNDITYQATTHLSNPELLIGTLAYTMFFFILGYLIFRKKRF
ncbi:ABC transporter permease [Lacticaseibacillus rhamnosus]|uniref:ABC transporter permease n=1 Tax=Lacticaseibacillus rhamnosus TaxID=47715 RepID=UPI00194EAC3C|nr:ABC transporter permease [Lacticaseibacillus rhamnosus]MBM6439408.1 ABC transporter permease [Lacticaseibacillus rhamnosus]